MPEAVAAGVALHARNRIVKAKDLELAIPME
jgi:hypothetical protein